MSKRWKILFFVLLLSGGAIWADIEVGVGFSPPLGKLPEGMPEKAAGPLGNTMVSFHAGYSFAWLFYLSGDAYVLPPFVVRNMTTTIEEDGFVKDGLYRPGFLNMINVGLRPRLGPVALSATVGLNSLYLYKEGEVSDKANKPSLGVNLRLGGILFVNDLFSFSLTGTTVFPDGRTLFSTLGSLGSKDSFIREQAVDLIVGNLYPTLTVNLNFEEERRNP